ncbi:MAG TPA: phosphatase PAP2 family protein, partial [Sorangium sp.]|nr:phosphatase PAP2 family protein [Sorangium sp.]
WAGYHRGWWNGVDSSCLTTLHDFATKHPSWVQFWEVVCAVFSPRGFRIVAAIAIVVVLIQRNLRAALFLILTVEISGVVIQVAKGLADRPRPVTALSPVSSTSFPSGHALGAMVGVLALLVVALPMINATAQTVLVAAGVLIVLAVGFGRVALNVHYPSDVVAGWALGFAYVVVWARLLRLPPPLHR